MKKLIAVFILFLAVFCVKTAYSADITLTGVETELIPLMTNGPPDKRINVVFVPEYYGGKRDEFIADVDLINDSLFEVEPFKSYKKYFNTAAIWLTFTSSPVDPILYFCGYEENGLCKSWQNEDFVIGIVGQYYQVKNVAVVFLYYKGVSGHGGPTHRWPNAPIGYVRVDMGRIYRKFLNQADESYSKVSARRSLVHEFGHAFGDLGDEYVNVIAPKRARGNEMIEDEYHFTPNLTYETRRDKIRWRSWIDPTTPVPTPKTSGYKDKVGLFEGAASYSFGIYRPMISCMMNDPTKNFDGSLSPNADKDPFCLVCREVLTRYISKFTVALEGTGYAVGETSTTFRAKLISDVGRDLQVKWFIDGEVVSRGLYGLDTLVVKENSLDIGAHTIRVEVRDTTSFVRDDPKNYLVESYEWQVVNTPTADFDRDGRVDYEDFFLFGDAFGGIVTDNPELSRFDLDMDGEIGFADFFLFCDSFGWKKPE